MNTQNKIFPKGLNFKDNNLEVCRNGTTNKINKLNTNANNPPNLFGIALRIAYANKKYHSGTMWIGVTNGFDVIKFSGSPNTKG